MEQSTFKKCILLDEQGKLVCDGEIKYFNSREALIRPSKVVMLNFLKKGLRILFQVDEDYSKIFTAVIYVVNEDSFEIEKIMENIDNNRKDLRIGVSYVCDVYHKNNGAEHKFTAKAINVSSNGIRFKSKTKMEKNKRYQCVVPWTDPEIIMDFEVVDIKQIYGYYFYGCRFMELCDEEETLLRCAIYKLQAMHYKTKCKMREAN